MTAAVIPIGRALVLRARDLDEVARWTRCEDTRAEALDRRDELLRRAAELRPRLCSPPCDVGEGS